MTKKNMPSANTSTQSARPPRQDEPAKSASDATATTLDAAALTSEITGAPTTAKAAPASAATDDGKKGGALQIVTRFPADLGARLDRYTESLRNERFGLRVSRADAVRILVHEALTAHEGKDSSRATPRPS